MPIAELDLVVVSGRDAGEYLQSQLTQDIKALDVAESTWACLLTPKSEIIALMSVERTGSDMYTLETEHGWGDVVRGTIDEFLGRMDVSFEQTTRQDAQADERKRIAEGWPRMGKEIDGSVTPAMVGIVEETVAFDKGCYTGQEFVARVHYRGAEPTKRLVRLVFDRSAPIDEGSEIADRGEVVGIVTSSAPGMALGYVKRGTTVPGSATAEGIDVEVLPIRPS